MYYGQFWDRADTGGELRLRPVFKDEQELARMRGGPGRESRGH